MVVVLIPTSFRHFLTLQSPYTTYNNTCIEQMVTENTVDADIYKMQQRKAKMNEAIMESKTVKDRKKEAEEVQAILKMAVSRYKTK